MIFILNLLDCDHCRLCIVVCPLNVRRIINWIVPSIIRCAYVYSVIHSVYLLFAFAKSIDRKVYKHRDDDTNVNIYIYSFLAIVNSELVYFFFHFCLIFFPYDVCIRWREMCSEAGEWAEGGRNDVPQYICAFTHHGMPFLLAWYIYFCTHHVLLFKRHEFKFDAQKIEQFRSVRCLFVCRTEVSRNLYTHHLNVDCVAISSTWLRGDWLEQKKRAFE